MATTPPDPAPPSAGHRAEQSAENGTATDWRAENERSIYQAAGIDPGDLSAGAASVVRWLAGWDQHTTRGLMELLAIAKGRTYLDNEKADLTAAAHEVVATVGTRTDPVMGELVKAADEWDWVVVPRDRIDALSETLDGS